ncbi:MAG: flagellar M-ring protein FliF [Rhizobiaceae bacterium]|nr:flagellar M-ring protein FliF [Rhizobiaceae bacterium]
MPEQIQRILDSLKALGPQRLAMLGGGVALVLAVLSVAAIYLNRPAYETLYVGLERADVNQIGMVLGEAGIPFDVASDGTTVLVAAGKTANARMLLAEKGLPTSANAGYELFDNVGSLGLTSFMQQITRIRALEGEIARTIQSIDGVRSARVHIVLPERGNFRREEQQPTASVVIRTVGSEGQRSAAAIRHLVAAAVPGLGADNVTVLDSSGMLLASGDDPSNSTLARAMDVERQVAAGVEENINRALAPYLGFENFRASVRASVNTDQRQTEETIFDPESRIERSVQVVRSNENASQSSSASPTSVEQNLPDPAAGAAQGPQSNEESERREETTNYELNTKRIATVSNGYTLSQLSIAVVVNQSRVAALVGANATPEQIAAKVAEIQALVTSAAGLSTDRGDQLNVSSVQFLDDPDTVAAGGGMLDSLKSQAGTMINALAFVVVAFLLVWFGLRPLTAAVAPKAAEPEAIAAGDAQRALPQPGGAEAQAALPGMAPQAFDPITGEPIPALQMAPMEGFHQRIKPAPQDRLARMVDLNDERTAQILRKWAAIEAAA